MVVKASSLYWVVLPDSVKLLFYAILARYPGPSLQCIFLS